jgi:hypothetical protein
MSLSSCCRRSSTLLVSASSWHLLRPWAAACAAPARSILESVTHAASVVLMAEAARAVRRAATCTWRVRVPQHSERLAEQQVTGRACRASSVRPRQPFARDGEGMRQVTGGRRGLRMQNLCLLARLRRWWGPSLTVSTAAAR